MSTMCSKCAVRPRSSKTCCYCSECKNGLARENRLAKKNGTFVSRCRRPRLSANDRDRRIEEMRLYQQAYRRANAAQLTKSKRDRLDAIKAEGIKEYGGKCACCGEPEVAFLTIDHIEGRSASDCSVSGRKITGKKTWSRLKVAGWPKENIQLLCFNCNCAKGIYGECPHKRHS